MDYLDIIGQIFWFGIAFTPVLSFIIVRKMEITLIAKIFLGILLTIILGFLFFSIALIILLRNGLGPT